MAPSVSVVITTYNRCETLEHVVRPLLADPAATEVIVVVDGCDDGSFEVLTAMAESEPRLLPVWIRNSGPARARRLGVDRASGEVVVLLDDDVVAGPGLVSGHANRHARGESIVVVGYMPITDWRSRERDRFSSYLYAREYERACERYERDRCEVLRGLWGGNVSLRRADCLRVGFCSDAFTARRGEDGEFGLRCLEAGLTGVFDRSLAARHLHVRTLDGFLRDAHDQGVATILVHRLHPHVLGPLDAGSFEAGLPVAARHVMRAARRPRLRRASVAALRPAVATAGRLGLFAVEVRAAQLARRIELQAGALEAARRYAIEGTPSGSFASAASASPVSKSGSSSEPARYAS